MTEPVAPEAATPTPEGGLRIPSPTLAFIATALERMGKALVALDGRTGILEAAPTPEPALIDNTVRIDALDTLTHMLGAHDPGALQLQPQHALALRRAVYDIARTLMAEDEICITEGEFADNYIGLSDVIELAGQAIDALGPCPNCHGERWVCEMHPNLPWDVPGGCSCSEGVPCRLCNPCDHFHPPVLQPGFDVIYASTRIQPDAPAMGS